MNFLKDVFKALLVTILIIFIVLAFSWLLKPDSAKKSVDDFQKTVANLNKKDSDKNLENGQNSSQNSNQNSDFLKLPSLDETTYFEGFVDNKYPIILTLTKDLENNLNGFLINKTVGLPTKVKGNLKADNSLILEEFNQNNVLTADFIGNFSVISDKLLFNGFWQPKKNEVKTENNSSSNSSNSEQSTENSADFNILGNQTKLSFSLKQTNQNPEFQTDLSKYNQFKIYPQISINNSDNYLIDAVYPEISRFPDSVISQKLNQNFGSIFNEQKFQQEATKAKEIKQKKCEEKKETECNLQSILKIRYQIEFNKNNLLSLVFYRETFLVDQENWQQEYFVYNYNLKTGESINLANFFDTKNNQNLDFKKVLTQKIKESNPNLNNPEQYLEYFNFNEKGVIIFFGSKNNNKILVKWKDLENIKSKEGLIKQIEN
jgi:hypothetical protein